MILLIRNTKGINIFEWIFYYLIRLFVNSRYNHAVLLKKQHGVWKVFESHKKGFRSYKTLETFIKEQNKYKREILPISLDNFDEERFKSVLFNEYNPRYWKYLRGKRSISPAEATNCFQSIGYIFHLPRWWAVKPKDIIAYNTNKFTTDEESIIDRLEKV